MSSPIEIVCDQKSGSEVFTKATYNGVQVIIRNCDGYVNATKMITTAPSDILTAEDRVLKQKNLGQHLGYKHQKEFIEAVFNRLQGKFWGNQFHIPVSLDKMIQPERAGYHPDYQGTYVHPKLTHLVAEYVSMPYRLIVTDVMDAINARNSEALAKEVQQLKDSNLEKSREVESLTSDVARLERTKRRLERQKAKLEVNNLSLANEVRHTSTRIANDKLLRLIRVREYLDNDEKPTYLYGVSSNNNPGAIWRDGEVVAEYIFPSAMHIRTAVRQEYRKSGAIPVFTQSEIDSVMNWIESKDPLFAWKKEDEEEE
jgi:hypothetical protein